MAAGIPRPIEPKSAWMIYAHAADGVENGTAEVNGDGPRRRDRLVKHPDHLGWAERPRSRVRRRNSVQSGDAFSQLGGPEP
jgi:hypothetical protein